MANKKPSAEALFKEGKITANQFLFSSAKDGDVAGIRKAVKAGANVNAVNERGESAVHLVVEALLNHLLEHEELKPQALIELKKLGADINAATARNNNDTPLHRFMYELMHDYFEITGGIALSALETFKQLGANFNALNSQGNTPIMAAYTNGGELSPYLFEDKLFADAPFLKAVKSNGGRFDILNLEGETLAHKMAGYDSLDLKETKKLGIELNVTDNKGRTPLHHHFLENRFPDNPENTEDFMKLLRDAGVDIHARDKDGNSAFDLYKQKVKEAGEAPEYCDYIFGAITRVTGIQPVLPVQRGKVPQEDPASSWAEAAKASKPKGPRKI
jgi:ankyrin repeat protein